MAAKLRALGVVTSTEEALDNQSFSLSKEKGKEGRDWGFKKPLSYAEATKIEPRRLGSVVWLQLGGEEVSYRHEQVAKWLVA